jgi:type II secretory pathway component PulK
MHERGSILITALWAVAFFSITTASLAFYAGEEVLMMKREINGLKHRMDFASGLNEAVEMIQEDPDPHEDSKDKSWFGETKPEQPFDRLSIALEDEESKLNLNFASAALLASFFKGFEDKIGPLKGSRKDYVKAITKLKYERKIESLEELLLLDDFKKEDFEILRPYLTVYPELPLINPNTASSLVLKALIDSLSGDHNSKQILLSRLEEACGIHGCFFTNKELAPEIFMEKLKLPKTPLMAQVVQDFLVSLTTDSQVFHVVVKSSEKAEASGIFTCRVGQTRPEVLWWHENY